VEEIETYRLDIVIRQLPNQCAHCLNIIINILQQHRLIAHNDTMLKKLLSGFSRDPREFIRVIEMCMQRNLLSAFPTSLNQANQLISPVILRIQSPARANTRTLCGNTESSNVGNSKETVADEAQVLWLKGVRITAGDDDVADDRVGGDILEHSLPTAKGRLEGGFSDGRGIGSDSVGTGAEAAVERAMG
jgi:hypothetical protein